MLPIPFCNLYASPNAKPGGLTEGTKMAGFNPDDYETVADRLARAHKDHENMRVLTDLVHVERDEFGKALQYIVRAQIWLGDILKAQDFAEEIVGNGMVNKSSALENCATSAIGRALADMNYQGSNKGKAQRPSREEMEKVSRVEESAKPIVHNPEMIALAQEAIEQVAQIETMDELKMFYSGSQDAGLLTIPVNGKTLNQVVVARKKELENVNA